MAAEPPAFGLEIENLAVDGLRGEKADRIGVLNTYAGPSGSIGLKGISGRAPVNVIASS
ncbi:MAG: hypothetical protein IRZ03_13050 [Acidobacterium ailaaui]|nr:hypothetical protein [Pseudacidobacterium ailaaui]